MDLFEKYNLSLGKIAKGFGVFVLALVVVMITFGLINSVLDSINRGNRSSQVSSVTGLGGSSIFDSVGKSANIELSTRNIIPNDLYTPGMDAEAFEVTEYVASIETRKFDSTCQSVADLKTKEYVIFENSNKGDSTCNYRFKVKKENVEEVLSLIDSLNPRDLNENIQTIKKEIDDFTSEEEVLKRKLQTIDDTLSSAVVSYDEISKLATQTRDAASLASIIDSKIKIVERLSQEKINTSSQLERISRLKAEQLDRLEYTYFSVYVYENKFVDFKQLKDSWKRSIKNFVVDMNGVLQDLSVGLVALVAYTFQYLLYLLIIVVTGKYVWKLFKRIWNK